ncbi:hypothetical protein H2200_000498 [Cladophialophora chaetospira]|uniref:Uncharacterized protein n=1 Tax=Cladophialophora chaetospira TaxID=386627 RepID=A0AA39CP86_9EURO|nr:hypothetical protein H2200_000498 [Cladophialophora chaetospira]
MPASSLDSLIVSADDFERYNGHHSLQTLGLPRPANDFSTDLVDPKRSPQDVAKWLAQPGPSSKDSDASMKFLLIQTRNQSTAKKPPSVSSLPVAFTREPPRRQTLERQGNAEFVIDIFNELGLPLAAFGAYIKAHITFICVPAMHTQVDATNTTGGSSCTKYYCSGTSWAVSWSHNPATRHTAAVMFYREGDGEQRKDEVLADLLRLQTHLSHPMLLGYIKTKVSLSFTFDMLDDMNRETLALEQEIGFPTWNWVLDREVPGNGVAETQDQAVEGFNVLSGKLTNIRFRLKTFQQQIKFISRCNNNYRMSLDPSSATFHASMRECNELDHFMNVMWDYTFIHLVDADSLGERLHNAMASVSQLTTQRDARASLAVAHTNNELAWQGKSTNKAMRTIAFVSLLFLPGTFVASFFDAPIFNFPMPQDQQQVIVPLPFWIFWFVSVMLTLALILGWMGYLRRSKRIDLRERDVERQQLGERIRKRQGGGPSAILLDERVSTGLDNATTPRKWAFSCFRKTDNYDVENRFPGVRQNRTELYNASLRRQVSHFGMTTLPRKSVA